MEWFRRWIVEGYSVRQLALQSRHSHRKLRRLIDSFLSDTPPVSVINPQTARYILFDGTFLHRPHSIAVLMNSQGNRVIRGQFGVQENSPPELRAFFKPMIDEGLRPRSFTVDGNRNVIALLKELWPDVIIQRCLVHIQRQGLSWCRISPKTAYARQLRKIFDQVTRIDTIEDKDAFLELVDIWESRYGKMIAGLKKSSPVFGDVIRARSMLMLALPNMFHYLNDPSIQTNTNALEGYFSRLKSHYRQHPGLSPRKRANYFAWFFHFKPR